MTSFAAPSYLSRRPMGQALRLWQTTLPAGATVYDIGCGQKPYEAFFQQQKYIGVDTDPASAADVQYDGTTIPLADASAEAIVCMETLQHARNPYRVVEEIYRLLKPGGTAFITVPFGIKLLAEPYPSPQPVTKWWRDDYWRFTKYGLLQLTRNFSVVVLSETTGYIGALFQLINYGVASLHMGSLARPVYVVNNALGGLADAFVKAVAGNSRFYEVIYLSFTTNYVLIIKK